MSPLPLEGIALGQTGCSCQPLVSIAAAARLAKAGPEFAEGSPKAKDRSISQLPPEHECLGLTKFVIYNFN